eukprot:1157521-Pelagomonas_calceolata.AAC.6
MHACCCCCSRCYFGWAARSGHWQAEPRAASSAVKHELRDQAGGQVAQRALHGAIVAAAAAAAWQRAGGPVRHCSVPVHNPTAAAAAAALPLHSPCIARTAAHLPRPMRMTNRTMPLLSTAVGAHTTAADLRPVQQAGRGPPGIQAPQQAVAPAGCPSPRDAVYPARDIECLPAGVHRSPSEPAGSSSSSCCTRCCSRCAASRCWAAACGGPSTASRRDLCWLSAVAAVVAAAAAVSHVALADSAPLAAVAVAAAAAAAAAFVASCPSIPGRVTGGCGTCTTLVGGGASGLETYDPDPTPEGEGQVALDVAARASGDTPTALLLPLGRELLSWRVACTLAALGSVRGARRAGTDPARGPRPRAVLPTEGLCPAGAPLSWPAAWKNARRPRVRPELLLRCACECTVYVNNRGQC